MKNLQLLLLVLFGINGYGQNYTSYFTGSEKDIVSSPMGGSCLMGGASEDDNAMIWFLERADGGDVLVLRASGSNGYNDYLYSELGVDINSVETIVFNDESASEELYIQDKIANAEAIWFAGGDQWNYVDYWRNTEIQNLINEAISDRNVVVGGTSAGMAVLGGFYFTAQNGTITSTNAMSNPFDLDLTVSGLAFLQVPFLESIVTDTHYDDPDRRGRHTTFIARASEDYGVNVKGIACDEYTAVCIDENGIAKVFGEYPENDDNAYFIYANCEVYNNQPEIMDPNTPLTWNHNQKAVKSCQIKGTPDGSNTFDLNDWLTSTNSQWEDWWIEEGAFFSSDGLVPQCDPLNMNKIDDKKNENSIFPNPNKNGLFHFSQPIDENCSLLVLNNLGECIYSAPISKGQESFRIDVQSSGVYVFSVVSSNKKMNYKVLFQP